MSIHAISSHVTLRSRRHLHSDLTSPKPHTRLFQSALPRLERRYLHSMTTATGITSTTAEPRMPSTIQTPENSFLSIVVDPSLNGLMTIWNMTRCQGHGRTLLKEGLKLHGMDFRRHSSVFILTQSFIRKWNMLVGPVSSQKKQHSTKWRPKFVRS